MTTRSLPTINLVGGVIALFTLTILGLPAVLSVRSIPSAALSAGTGGNTNLCNGVCGACALRDALRADAPPGFHNNNNNADSSHVCAGHLLYLHSLQLSLTGMMHQTRSYTMKSSYDGSHTVPYDYRTYERGGAWPVTGSTMVGAKRLRNVAQLLTDVLCRNVEGDFLEAGVWRGGTSAFAGSVLGSLGTRSRAVWLADSFSGLPPGAAGTVDGQQPWDKFVVLAVSQEAVEANVRAVEPPLPLSSFRFVKGYFNDSLPQLRAAAAERGLRSLAVLRMDGDMWSSTADILYNLYDFVPVSGYVIVDDGLLPARQCVSAFLAHHHASEKFIDIDGESFYFQKTHAFPVDYAHYPTGRVAPPAP